MASPLLIAVMVANVVVAGSVCFAEEFQASSCDESALSTEVAHGLSKEFSSWRVLRMQDLSLVAQQLWRDTKSGRCPGIAAGNFEPASGPSYALLLVRRGPKPNSLKLVVLVKDLQGVYQPMRVEDLEMSVHGQVIYKVPPARYSPSADGSEGIQLERDGFKIEEIGVGAVLYFWEDARYIRSYRSKGYSELIRTQAGGK